MHHIITFLLVACLSICTTNTTTTTRAQNPDIEGIVNKTLEEASIVFMNAKYNDYVAQELLVAYENVELPETLNDDTDVTAMFFTRKLHKNSGHNGDCSCPTDLYYYRLHCLVVGGVTWYPVETNQIYHWHTVGKCVSLKEECYTDKLCNPFSAAKYCQQRSEYKFFLVYRTMSTYPYVEIRSHIFPVPTTCYCPHCSHVRPLPV